MTVADAARELNGAVVGVQEDAAREVLGGYVSDLLSDVMANAQEGELWVTVQKHQNIVAVAHVRGLAGVVLINGRQPEAETMARATEEHVPIVCTPLSAFEAAGILYGLGLRRRRNP